MKLHEQGKLTEAELVEVLGKIQLQTSRTIEQINRHREFLKAGKTQKEPTSIPAIIEAIKPMIDIATAHAGVDVAYSVPPIGLELKADSIQLQQAILNLVKNSIEAMEAGEMKKVTIGAGQVADDRFYMSVKDTGPGFPETFEFGKTTKPDGMGLGLKIVKQITEFHGGTLELKDKTAKMVIPAT